MKVLIIPKRENNSRINIQTVMMDAAAHDHIIGSIWKVFIQCPPTFNTFIATFLPHFGRKGNDNQISNLNCHLWNT